MSTDDFTLIAALDAAPVLGCEGCDECGPVPSIDDFTTAARAEARREAPHYDRETLAYGKHMAEWARTHLAAQEPSDAECVAALDVKYGGPLEPYGAPYDDEEIEETRAALSAYRAIRRDEEAR